MSGKYIAQLNDKELERLYRKIHRNLQKGGGCEYGWDMTTLRLVRPHTYRVLVELTEEVKERGRRCTCYGINFHDVSCPQYSVEEQELWS